MTIDALTSAMPIVVLLLLAKMFVKTPISLSGALLAFVKTALLFTPAFLVISIVAGRAETWGRLAVDALEMSLAATLIVLAIKALLRRFGARTTGCDVPGQSLKRCPLRCLQTAWRTIFPFSGTSSAQISLARQRAGSLALTFAA